MSFWMDHDAKICFNSDPFDSKRNANNTLFLTLSQTFTILLDEINVCPTTLSGFHFQNVGPTLI